jgi:hypothetical protein
MRAPSRHRLSHSARTPGDNEAEIERNVAAPRFTAAIQPSQARGRAAPMIDGAAGAVYVMIEGLTR